MDKQLLARIMRQGGGKLIDLAVSGLLKEAPLPGGEDAPAAPRKSSLGAKLTGAAVTRIATRSVPGAIVIGGGLLAKTLYDRKKAKRAAASSKTGG